MPSIRPHPAVLYVAGAALALLAIGAQAQAVYRIVGPDGRVTYSDKPPADPSVRASPAAVAPLTGGATPSAAALPFELRQVSSRYPVTLYSGSECGPCEQGRRFLGARGIPFTEKLVKSNEDIAALQRLSGTATLPFMTIGSQQLKGFSEVEWGQFLDAAGYPKTSQLPPGYRQAAATPLVVAEPPRAAAPVATRPVQPEAAQPAAPAPAGPAPDNPAGIRF